MSEFYEKFLSEPGFQAVFTNSMDDLRFAAEQAVFFKSIATAFTDFNTKIQKIVSKQDNSRLYTYPTGSFKNQIAVIISAIKKTGVFLGEFGSSLEDVTLALNTTCKSRTAERQKLYGESNSSLSLVKASKTELEKKNERLSF